MYGSLHIDVTALFQSDHEGYRILEKIKFEQILNILIPYLNKACSCAAKKIDLELIFGCKVGTKNSKHFNAYGFLHNIVLK